MEISDEPIGVKMHRVPTHCLWWITETPCQGPYSGFPGCVLANEPSVSATEAFMGDSIKHRLLEDFTELIEDVESLLAEGADATTDSLRDAQKSARSRLSSAWPTSRRTSWAMSGAASIVRIGICMTTPGARSGRPPRWRFC
jgi:ElaB/YqjD/DUF883 family membrane-anchored ribosome-binding protein